MSGDKSTGGCSRFAESADNNVNLIDNSCFLAKSQPESSARSERVCLIYIKYDVVIFLFKVCQFTQRCRVTIHAVDRLQHNDTPLH